MPVRFLSPAHYQSYGQYNGSPNKDQLSRYFYLNDFDLVQIKHRRRKSNRMGFALQLVTVRFLGTYLDDMTAIPAEVHRYLSEQLLIEWTDVEIEAYNQSRTFWHHQASINDVYGYRSFHDVLPSYQFLRWLYTRVRIGSERPSLLFDLSTAWLIDHKILLPGVTTLERLVSQVRDRVERRSWDAINRQLSHEQKQQIQYLISATDENNIILFDTLRQMPTHNSSPQIRFMLDRLDMLRSHQLQMVNVSNLSPNRLKTLADYALTASATTLRRLTLKRQTAVVLAGMIMLEIRIQDLILYMVNQGFHESVTRAKYKYKENRLQSLAEFDQAAFQLRDFAQFLIELPEDKSVTIPQLFSLFQKQQIEASIASIDRVKNAETSNYRGLLIKYYRSIRRFLALFLHLIPFQSVSDDNTTLVALRFLHQLELGHKSLQDAPRAVITSSWQAFVVDENGDIQRDAYTICVLQELLRQLRQRDIYIMPSEQWYDPRQFLIDVNQWDILKPQICRLLDRSPQPDSELKNLAQQLNDAYQQANEALVHDPDLRMEVTDGIARPIVTPLDAVPETPELLFLQQALTKRLPAVDLPELMLEVHQMTGFADAFSHISEQQARMADLPVTICAILLAEGCNIGLEAVVDEDVPALSFDRLRSIQQNYIRPDTIAEASRWLIDAQAQLHIAQLWGGGELASADGLRFVVPPRALHGGFNRKYFGSGRGVTFFNFMNDQFTGFHHIVIPGTLREALFILDGLLDQSNPVQPTEIMTDTNSYTDVVFGLFWLLGFQFSPRLADIKDQRFWGSYGIRQKFPQVS